MNVLKQKMRLVLMSLMLLVCGASIAQTQVVFEAGVDVGATNSLGNHHIDKEGVTFGGTRCNLAKKPYDFQTSGGVSNQKITVTSAVGNIQKIEIEGKNLNLITGQNVGTFNSSTGVWEGNSNDVELTIKYTISTSNKVTVSKVTVTLAQSVATSLSFGDGAQTSYTVYKGQESSFTPLTATVTEKKNNTVVANADVKYSSNAPEVASVNETTGAITFGKIGDATITASYAGVDGVYDAASDISYTISYKKNPLTLKYDNTLSVIYADDKDKFSTPSLSIKSGETEIHDMAVAYKSSNSDVATVAKNGTVKLLGIGEATITASATDNDNYEDATATFTVRVADPDNIFYESFDNVEGEGGNDGNWSIDKGTSFNSGLCDNEGWSKRSNTTFQEVTGGDKCMNIYGQANLYSPELKYLNGQALLTFRAGADKAAVLTVTVNGKESKFNVPANEFKEFSMPINGASSTKIDFYGYWTAGGSITGTIYNIFIDDVKVVKLVTITENSDNTAAIEANDGKNVNIMLDRKLSNEYWNTICLPFSMNKEQISEVYGEGSELRSFYNVEDSKLVFAAADAIEAGVPYLFKPANSISGSVFLRSDIKLVSNATTTRTNEATGQEYKFVGVISPTALEATDIFIGTDGNLYYPDMDTEGANMINGMRAYMQLPDGTDAKTFVINTDGETTAINNAPAIKAASTAVYTISGQKVGNHDAMDKLPRGIYIAGGKKIVVK